MQNRALGAVRLSVKKDDSTSPERQKLAIGNKADTLGTQVVGIAEDLNVSASKFSPFHRPQLGEWLNTRSDEFDTIIFWRLDRAVRSMRDLHTLTSWARDNHKRVVFCEGQAANFSFDFRGPVQKGGSSIDELLVMIIAWAAQMESEAISERVSSSHKYLRQNGEWGGGVVPYGFVPEAKETRGFRLVHNPETLPILQEIIRRVLDGEPLLPICRDLNERGIPTPRDWWESYKGRDRKGRRWNTPGMKLILQSRALLGEWHYEGQLVVDEKGDPIERGKPVVTHVVFKRLQDALLELSMAPKRRYEDPNPLLGVAFCARCGLPYYLKQEKQKDKVYKSLSCRSRHGDQHESCGQPTLSLQYACAIAEHVVLTTIGDNEVLVREFVPGDNRSEKLDQLRNLLQSLEEERDQGLILDKDSFFERKKKFIAQIRELEGGEVSRPAGYVWHGTGETYGVLWPTLGTAERLKLMTDLGVKVYFGRGDAPAAEAAWAMQGDDDPKLPPNTQLARFYDVGEVERALGQVQDGARIKKDFQVWALQSTEGFPDEVLARKDVTR